MHDWLGGYTGVDLTVTINTVAINDIHIIDDVFAVIKKLLCEMECLLRARSYNM